MGKKKLAVFRVNKVVSCILIVSLLISHLSTIANAGTVFGFGYTITAIGTEDILSYPDQNFYWEVTGTGTETYLSSASGGAAGLYQPIPGGCSPGTSHQGYFEQTLSEVINAGSSVHLSFAYNLHGGLPGTGTGDGAFAEVILVKPNGDTVVLDAKSVAGDTDWQYIVDKDVSSHFDQTGIYKVRLWGKIVTGFLWISLIICGSAWAYFDEVTLSVDSTGNVLENSNFLADYSGWTFYLESGSSSNVWIPDGYQGDVYITETVTATDSGSGMVNQIEGNKYIGSFNAYPQPQHGGTVSGVTYSISDDNPNVNTWISGTSVYASTDHSEIQTIPWGPSSETGSSSVNTDDGDTYICTSTLVAPNGDTVWSVVDDSDEVHTWMVGSALYGRVDPVPPTVVTNAATAVSAYSAILNGNLNGRGTASPVQVSFEWGLTSSYGYEATPQAVYSTGPFNYSLSELVPNTTYHFRAKAVGDGVSYGSDIIFTTSPLYDLVMQFTGSGSTTPSIGSHQYAEGTVVDITATPSPGWQFDGWTGDVANPSSASTTVTIDSSKTVTANFSQIMHTLTMQVTGSGFTTPAVGPHSYAEGTVVNITATPASGWQFDNWTGDVANPASALTTETVDAGKT